MSKWAPPKLVERLCQSNDPPQMWSHTDSWNCWQKYVGGIQDFIEVRLQARLFLIQGGRPPAVTSPEEDFTFRTDQNKLWSSTSAWNCCVTTANNKLTTPCCNSQLLSVFGKPIQLKPSVNTPLYGFLFWSVLEWKGKLTHTLFWSQIHLWNVDGNMEGCVWEKQVVSFTTSRWLK